MKLAPALLILFVAICINYLIVFINYRNEKNSSESVEINESVAGAMASKISSDAQQHRKNRERYNYIKSKTDKRE